MYDSHASKTAVGAVEMKKISQAFKKTQQFDYDQLSQTASHDIALMRSVLYLALHLLLVLNMQCILFLQWLCKVIPNVLNGYSLNIQLSESYLPFLQTKT